MRLEEELTKKTNEGLLELINDFNTNTLENSINLLKKQEYNPDFESLYYVIESKIEPEIDRIESDFENISKIYGYSILGGLSGFIAPIILQVKDYIHPADNSLMLLASITFAYLGINLGYKSAQLEMSMNNMEKTYYGKLLELKNLIQEPTLSKQVIKTAKTFINKIKNHF